MLLNYLWNDSSEILLLWSGAIEPIEISRMDNFTSLITAVDWNINVCNFYDKIITSKVIWKDIETHFKNKVVWESSIRWDYVTKMDSIKSSDLKNINFIKKKADDFLVLTNSKYKLITAHNLLNNLRFQDAYTNKKILNFYKSTHNILKDEWIFSIEDNYNFFQTSNNNISSTLEHIEKWGFDILCHYPSYVSEINTKNINCINENNVIACIKKWSAHFFNFKISRLSQYYWSLFLQYDVTWFTISTWTYNQFKKALNGAINIVLIKISLTEYFWLNIYWTYEEVFTTLAQKWCFPNQNAFNDLF